jgi:hypothetical protein
MSDAQQQAFATRRQASELRGACAVVCVCVYVCRCAACHTRAHTIGALSLLPAPSNDYELVAPPSLPEVGVGGVLRVML